MKTIRQASVLWSTLLLTACVTINVYFPAAAAESAADRIIEDIIGAPADGEAISPEQSPTSMSPDASPEPLAIRVLEWLIPVAEAGQANIDIDTPAIRRLRASMKQRYGRLNPWFQSGAIGYKSDGLIGIRDLKALPVKDRNAAKRLVAEENEDRNALYREIASANGHPEWEGEIRSTFARRWPEKAAPGTWVQDGAGKWKQR